MKQNVGIFTNPKNELYLGPCEPKADNLECGPDEVVLHVRATGICASDVHFWKEGRVGDTMVVRNEHILGHESAADVLKIGSKVKNVKVGDRVAIEPGMQCLVCEQCLTGCYNGCPDVQFKSTPPYPGQLRRYIVHPARLVHPIGNLSYEEGALLEPISVGLAGLEQSGLELGDPTVICGAGPIGLVSALLARAAGAAPIVITDLDENRLKKAKELVPTIHTLKIDLKESSQQTAERIIEACGQKPKICLECTGFESSINAGVYSLGFRGTCEIIGVGTDFVNLAFMHASVNEITIRGLFRYANTWPRGIRLLKDGLVDARPLITHRFKLEDGVEAFNTFIDRSTKAIKVMIVDNEDVE